LGFAPFPHRTWHTFWHTIPRWWHHRWVPETQNMWRARGPRATTPSLGWRARAASCWPKGNRRPGWHTSAALPISHI